MEINKGTLERMLKMRLYGMYNASKTSMENIKSESMTNDQFIS